MDCAALTDADLDVLRRDLQDEFERRLRLARIPAEVARLACAYVEDGGDCAELEQAVATATAPTEPPAPEPEPEPAPEPDQPA